jgi:hypothetical protein
MMIAPSQLIGAGSAKARSRAGDSAAFECLVMPHWALSFVLPDGFFAIEKIGGRRPNRISRCFPQFEWLP